MPAKGPVQTPDILWLIYRLRGQASLPQPTVHLPDQTMVETDATHPACETVRLQLNRYVLRLEFVMSLSSGLIAAVALAYMAIMFAIAFWGDRRSASLPPTLRAWVYSLSLAVYCTSWTFFGAVGQAAEQFWSFLPIYIGPILLMLLAPWVQ